jgi:hypothetical protein
MDCSLLVAAKNWSDYKSLFGVSKENHKRDDICFVLRFWKITTSLPICLYGTSGNDYLGLHGRQLKWVMDVIL